MRRALLPARLAITSRFNCSCSTTALTVFCFGSISSATTISATRCPTAHNCAIWFVPSNRPVLCCRVCCSPALPGRWRRATPTSARDTPPAKPISPPARGHLLGGPAPRPPRPAGPGGHRGRADALSRRFLSRRHVDRGGPPAGPRALGSQGQGAGGAQPHFPVPAPPPLAGALV